MGYWPYGRPANTAVKALALQGFRFSALDGLAVITTMNIALPSDGEGDVDEEDVDDGPDDDGGDDGNEDADDDEEDGVGDDTDRDNGAMRLDDYYYRQLYDCCCDTGLTGCHHQMPSMSLQQRRKEKLQVLSWESLTVPNIVHS